MKIFVSLLALISFSATLAVPVANASGIHTSPTVDKCMTQLTAFAKHEVPHGAAIAKVAALKVSLYGAAKLGLKSTVNYFYGLYVTASAKLAVLSAAHTQLMTAWRACRNTP